MSNTHRTKEELLEELSLLEKTNKSLRERVENTEALLELAEEKLRKSITTSSDSVNINRLSDGMYVSINEGFTRIMGYTNEDIAGKTSLELNIWNNPLSRNILIDELVEKGKIENFEAEFIKKDGSIVTGLMSASVIDLNGVPHILSITRDLTHDKRIENDLKREQYFINALMENLNDYIYFKDRESRFLRINRSHATSFGLEDPCDAVGKNDFDYFTPEHARQAFSDEQNIMITGKPVTRIEKHVKPNKPDKWSLSTKLPLFDTSHNVIGTFGISRDITEQKMSEEEIKFKNELLQELNAEKDKFFSIIAHDLKGPLSSFVAATQMIIEGKQTMSIEEIVELAGIMKTEASSIYNLLENLLEWSRFKRGLMQYNPVDFLLREKISSGIELLKEPARLKGINIEIIVPTDYEIIGDINMFDTIIRNLVSNALKFTNSGGKIIITASCKDNGFYEIEVRDSGIGIPPEIQRKLFCLSEKINRTGTAGEPSSGLGLLLCKEFIDKHEGRIRVESETGKGSRFIFTMPAHIHTGKEVDISI
jgi:two-component system, sensor histidine kinase and response regulator